MDKRSILFIVCVTAAFFCVQTWFTSSNEKERIAYETRVAEQEAERRKELEAEAALKTAKAEELPIVPLFADAKAEVRLGTAVQCGSHFLTISWADKLPQNVFMAGGESVQLAGHGKAKEVAIYSRSKEKLVSVPSLQVSRTDLQLVDAKGSVAFGEQFGREVVLPYHILKESAIALVSEGGVYLPVGIFEPDAKRVRALNEFQWTQGLVQQGQPVSLAASNSGEEFYVLENAYQQLVFSTRGGSLAEINLPMRQDRNSASLVKEIDIDRQILAQSPQNAHFPLHPYKAFVEGRVVLQTEGRLGGYYPLLRRAILNADGTERSAADPQYYAFNIVGEDPAIGETNYRVTRFEPNLIQFEGSVAGRRIVKTFSIPEEKNGPYCLQLETQIDGDARGLWLSSGVPDVELVGGSYAPLLRYQLIGTGGPDVDTIDLPKKGPNSSPNIHPNWISNSNGYFALLMDPLKNNTGDGFKATQINGNDLPTRLTLIDSAYNLYKAADYPGYATYLPLKSAPTLFRLFAGPLDDALLKDLDALYEDPVSHYNPEYNQAQKIQGWFSFISEPFAKFLFILMQLFYAICRSWAVSIILLTIALKAMMYPLNAWSIRSAAKMQEIAPKVKLVQEKYKKDPKRAQMEVMNIYRESKVNPITGCLPMLLQMPFLIGMFYLLKSSFPLRGAVFIPGWIDDLAAPDVLFTWGQPIWFFGNEFHLLPILMGATMYIQQKMTSKLPKDASQLSDSQKQQKMMGNMMSVLFTVMFYSFPSGLNIYFMFSTLLGVLQQWWMTKAMAAKK
jgi:YidC/Oxa1 family membrane protein insertase